MHRLVRFGAACLACLSFAAPAAATEWMFCADRGSTVTVGLLLGQADTLSAVEATLEHRSARYTTNTVYGEGKLFRLKSVAAGRSGLRVEFLDAAGNAPLGDLRLAETRTGNSTAYRGKLRLAGRGAWRVSCDPD